MNEKTKELLVERMTENLVVLRAKLGITQAELADIAGMSRQTILAIEKKQRTMTWNTFLSLLFIFSVNKNTEALLKLFEILTDELNKAFVEGMESFGRMIRGYNDCRALISGVESRTSSPVRINRDKDCVSENVGNLYPCGEGAGYAGGIMSAAMDGIRIAQMIAERSRRD